MFRELCFFWIPICFSQKDLFQSSNHQRTSIQHHEAQPHVLQPALVFFASAASCAYLYVSITGHIGLGNLAKRERESYVPHLFSWNKKSYRSLISNFFRVSDFAVVFFEKWEALRQIKMLKSHLRGPSSDLKASSPSPLMAFDHRSLESLTCESCSADLVHGGKVNP